MIHDQELGLVEHDDLFELVVEIQNVLAVARHELFSLDEHVLVGVGCVVPARGDQVAVGGAAQEIRDKFKFLAIPRIEQRTGRSLPVQFLDPDDAIRGGIDFALQDAARPPHRYRIGLGCRIQPDPHDRAFLR